MVLRINRGWHRRQPTRDEQAFLRMRIREIASVRKRYGYRRIHVLLLREGWKINHKRVYRLYKEEGLNLRKPTGRKKISVSRAPEKGLASTVNECWCMDFVSDQLYNGKRFRALTVLDTFSRESLVIYVDKSIRGEQVCEALEKVKAARGLPARIKVDNGPEFISPGARRLGVFQQSQARLLPARHADG